MSFTVYLAKENFKFSCTHFTIFSSHEGERLHGHNYQVSCALDVPNVSQDLGMAFDFNAVKPVIKKLCDKLDERILIPKLSPYLSLKEHGTQVQLKFADKLYEFPKDDAIELPVVNITAEELARYFCTELKKTLDAQKLTISRVSIRIDETTGQGAEFTLP